MSSSADFESENQRLERISKQKLQGLSADFASKTQELKNRVNSQSVRNLKPELMIGAAVVSVVAVLFFCGLSNVFLFLNFLTNTVFRVFELVLRVLSMLLLPLSVLFVAALYTCPSSDTFVPYMKSMISFFNQDKKESQSLYDSILNYGATKLAEYALFSDPMFLNCGVCTLVKCKNGSKYFWAVGVFKVWVPLSG